VISQRELLIARHGDQLTLHTTSFTMSYEISPAARPIYDDKIDGKDDEKADEKDIMVTPAELTFGDNHLDTTEQSHIRR
jgi:nitrous oxide reductase